MHEKEHICAQSPYLRQLGSDFSVSLDQIPACWVSVVCFLLHSLSLLNRSNNFNAAITGLFNSQHSPPKKTLTGLNLKNRKPNRVV